MSTPDPSGAIELAPVPVPRRGSGPVVCCGGHRDRCLFGDEHVFSTWFDAGHLMRTVDTYHCHRCGGVCTGDEDERSAGKTAAWLAGQLADERPADPAAVQADDTLLDALRTGKFDPLLRRAGVTNVPVTSTDYELTLAKVLDAWRRDVDSVPVGELVDTDDAVAAIRSYEPPRLVSPFFTSLVAALALTAGVGLGLLILALVI